MNDFDRFRTYRKEAVRFWEIRRAVYNLFLVLPTVFVYGVTHARLAGAGTEAAFGLGVVSILFVLGAIAANACYSLVYLLEFWLADAHLESGWISGGRAAIFAVGLVLAISFAMLAAYGIAGMQFPKGHLFLLP